MDFVNFCVYFGEKGFFFGYREVCIKERLGEVLSWNFDFRICYSCKILVSYFCFSFFI